MNSSKSVVRRLNIKAHLKHGEMRVLADKMNTNPNYLSQLFSLKSTRPVSDKMTRKVESALGLSVGTLDQEISEDDLISSSILTSESSNLLTKSKSLNRIKSLSKELVYNRLVSYYPSHSIIKKKTFNFLNTDIEADVLITSSNHVKLVIDVKVMNDQAPFKQKPLLNGLEHLSLVMNITGTKHGLLVICDETDTEEVWLSMESGVLEQLATRPEL